MITDSRTQEVKYARICSDMNGFSHFWPEVAEMKRVGWSYNAC